MPSCVQMFRCVSWVLLHSARHLTITEIMLNDVIFVWLYLTGKVEVTGEQALIWILDDEERRNIIAARRAGK